MPCPQRLPGPRFREGLERLKNQSSCRENGPHAPSTCAATAGLPAAPPVCGLERLVCGSARLGPLQHEAVRLPHRASRAGTPTDL